MSEQKDKKAEEQEFELPNPMLMGPTGPFEEVLPEADLRIQAREINVRSMLASIPNEDIYREGLQKTPNRVARMYDELFSGYDKDPTAILKSAMFKDENCKSLVVVKDIQFSSMCEHHMMPFFGTATIAYIPQNGDIVGLSKFARLVDCFARRLQVQERMCKQIADTMEDVLNPRGLAVIINAGHTCMWLRGVQKPGSFTTTSDLRGVFLYDDKARTELYDTIKMENRVY